MVQREVVTIAIVREKSFCMLVLGNTENVILKVDYVYVLSMYV